MVTSSCRYRCARQNGSREPGGNGHYERFCEEVLPKLARGEHFAYRMFNYGKLAYDGYREVPALPYYYVEGSYSNHPVFGDYADVKALSDIGYDEQITRIFLRDGSVAAERFRTRWIPMEEQYFKEFHTKELGFQEHRSAGKFAGIMKGLGLRTEEGLAVTGVKSYLKNSSDGPTICLMGELDGLPIPNHAYANPGDRRRPLLRPQRPDGWRHGRGPGAVGSGGRRRSPRQRGVFRRPGGGIRRN